MATKENQNDYEDLLIFLYPENKKTYQIWEINNRLILREGTAFEGVQLNDDKEITVAHAFQLLSSQPELMFNCKERAKQLLSEFEKKR